MAEAYPLTWPESWNRNNAPERSRFDVSWTQAYQELIKNLELFGAEYIIISTNAPLNRQGKPLPMYDFAGDCGVAVYFGLKKKHVCIPCDQWDQIHHNMRAISKTLDALRGIERWGAKNILDRAMSAFTALPHTTQPHTILGIAANATGDEIRAARGRLARLYHPDAGTQKDHQKMAEVNAAADAMLNKL